MNRVFLSTAGRGVSRAEQADGGTWRTEVVLPDRVVQCLAPDPKNPTVVYAGTRDGILRSDDCGHSWRASGLEGSIVKSIAVSPREPGTVYAGLKPPRLMVSRDSGAHWLEIQSFQSVRARWWRSPAESDLGAYIQGIALSPSDPRVIVVGIEAGAVLRTSNGGASWESHRPGSLRDCHTVLFHGRDGNWVYEAGGTGTGASFSRDGGRTWRQPKEGLDRHYGWACAADPASPEVWYVSASPTFTWSHPFQPPAHVDGRANAFIYRSAGGAPWEKLGGGLPQPLQYMAYGLVTDVAEPGHLYAGMSNGEVWHSSNYGDAWQKMPFNLNSIHRTLVMLK